EPRGLEKNPDSVYLAPRFVVLSARHPSRVELYLFVDGANLPEAAAARRLFIAAPRSDSGGQPDFSWFQTSVNQAIYFRVIFQTDPDRSAFNASPAFLPILLICLAARQNRLSWIS